MTSPPVRPLVVTGRVRQCEVRNFTILRRDALIAYVADPLDAVDLCRRYNACPQLVEALTAVIDTTVVLAEVRNSGDDYAWLKALRANADAILHARSVLRITEEET